MKIRSILVRCVLPFFFFPLLASAKVQWTPVSPEDLAATTSKTGADIEMLLMRTVLDTSGGNAWVDSTVEAKVYTKKGVENMSILHVTYMRKERIWDVAARVVKRDGSIVELTKKDFIESSAAKKSDLDLRETSFAFPGVEPGDVVQYHWKTGQTKSTFAISSVVLLPARGAGAAVRIECAEDGLGSPSHSFQLSEHRAEESQQQRDSS